MPKSYIFTLRNDEMNHQDFTTTVGEVVTTKTFYNFNINIPEAKVYKTFKLYVKDFMVIRSTVAQTEDLVYTLHSNTLQFIDTYDSIKGYNGSTSLCSVHNQDPKIINGNEQNSFEIRQFNGNHTIWLEVQSRTVPTTHNNSDFHICFVIIGYE